MAGDASRDDDVGLCKRSPHHPRRHWWSTAETVDDFAERRGGSSSEAVQLAEATMA
jgi:hypothetical protein